MALTDSLRIQAWADFMRKASARQEVIGGTMTKTQLRTMVNYIDDWIDSNISNFKGGMPEPGKSQLTNKQKFELFKLVLCLKYEEEVS